MRFLSLATLTIILYALLDIPTIWLATRFYQMHLAENFLPGLLYALTITTLRQKIIDKIGFGIPIDIAVLLSQSLDERVIARQPDLAIALGTSPCDKRFGENDERTGVCATALAGACYDAFAKGRPNVESVGCREEFGSLSKRVTGHFARCHPAEDLSYFALMACVRVTERILRDKEMCPATASVFTCSERFGLSEIIFKSLRDRS